MKKTILMSIMLCLYSGSNWFTNAQTPNNDPASDDEAKYEKDKAAYDLCTQGINCLNEKNYTQAKALLEQASTYDPSSSSACIHTNMGSMLFDLGKFEEAIAEYNKVLKFDPENAIAFFNLANAYTELNDKPKAKLYWEKYIATHPADVLTAQSALQALDRPDVSVNVSTSSNSIQTNDTASNKNDETAYNLYKQGEDYLQAKNYTQAKALLEQASTYDPSASSVPIHSDLGYILFELGKHEESIVEYNKVLKLDPENANAFFNLANIYTQLSNIPKAKLYWQKYIATHPDAKGLATAQRGLQTLGHAEISIGDVNAPDYYDATVAAEQEKGVGRWSTDKLPIKVFIPDSSDVLGYRPLFRQILIDSFKQWMVVSNGKLSWVLVPNASEADIVCSWIQHVTSGTEAGEAMTYFIRRGHGDIFIDKATIKISTLDFDGSTPLNDIDIELACLHEIGHALGIIGHSPNEHDVMYFVSRDSSPSLSPTSMSPVAITARDAATLNRLYAYSTQ